LNISAISMSIIRDRIFSKSFSSCSAATESHMTRGMFLIKCRTFGAHFNPSAAKAATKFQDRWRPRAFSCQHSVSKKHREHSFIISNVVG
jgi:hypothetical protein